MQIHAASGTRFVPPPTKSQTMITTINRNTRRHDIDRKRHGGDPTTRATSYRVSGQVYKTFVCFTLSFFLHQPQIFDYCTLTQLLTHTTQQFKKISSNMHFTKPVIVIVSFAAHSFAQYVAVGAHLSTIYLTLSQVFIRPAIRKRFSSRILQRGRRRLVFCSRWRLQQCSACL